MPDCVFCKIAAGEIPSYSVYEDEHSMAFLDIGPLFPGHVLLVPKQHVDTFPDLDPAQLPNFFGAAQKLTRAVEQALSADGTFMAINNKISQSVPHLHLHIVPRKKKDGLKGFFWPRRNYDGEDHMREVQAAIKSALQQPA